MFETIGTIPIGLIVLPSQLCFWGFPPDSDIDLKFLLIQPFSDINKNKICEIL